LGGSGEGPDPVDNQIPYILTTGELCGSFIIKGFMQTVTISVSDSILTAANMDKEEMAAAMSREYAMKMFHQGKLTLVQSAEFCGLDIYDFMTALSQAGIPVIDYDLRELEKELSYFK
jgi:predicted HTH domain antitoxin